VRTTEVIKDGKLVLMELKYHFSFLKYLIKEYFDVEIYSCPF